MKLERKKAYELPTGILDLAHSPDGKLAYAACCDGHLYEMDLATGKSVAFASQHTSFASGCVLTRDGQTLISAGYDGWLLWHDVATRRCWRRVQAHTFWSWQLALSPDGNFLATTSGQYLPGGWKYEPAAATEPSVKIYHARTGDLLAAYEHGPPVLSCAFSPDSQFLAAANMMGEVKVWNVTAASNPAPVATFSTPDFTSWGSTKTHHYCGGIYGLAFSPDGSHLLACGMGPMVDPMAGNGKMTWQRWNWSKGEKLDQIKDGQHGSGLMESIAWSPSGEHFMMAGRQAQGTWNLAVFSTHDGSLVHSQDTKKRITRARFLPDSQTVLVAGATGQPGPKNGVWPAWGKLQVFEIG